ncbi:MAG TPA: response regulator [Verrucomicrobiae bacterium]
MNVGRTVFVGKKILFVDDDEMWRKRVTASLAAAGYDPVTAGDASEAMALADQAHPRVIILDIDLNGEDGVILLKFLKRNHPKTPILVFTGVEHDQAEIQDILALGADQYLAKTNADQLIVAVGSYA